MQRYAAKIVGRSGQGINLLGELLAKGLKRSGNGVYAYREYPSLIQGGHASYQVDFSDSNINSSTKQIDLLLVLNKQGTQWHLEEFKDGGLIFHDIENPRINQQEYQIIKQKNIKMVYVPALPMSIEVGGSELTANIVTIGAISNIVGLNKELMLEIVRETFQDKPKFIEINTNCFKAGYDYKFNKKPNYKQRLLKPDEIENSLKDELHINSILEIQNYFKKSNKKVENNYLLTGNEALALGAINAGVRIYYAYPMTPSSPILDYLAEHAHQTGMIVKQVEDEITAAAMVIGSMHAGTRALTGTSGGGFDLMTEHISLSAIIETPFVCILGQRPGPATGMPTWTTQGDLMLAIHSSHGEFSRVVLSVSDSEDAFYTIQEAMNLADVYQIPVIVLADKLMGESLYSVRALDPEKIKIDRGMLITNQDELDKLESKDRYKLTESGISKRWLPGSKANDYDANSDEHTEEGNVTEDSEPAKMMIEKRIKKIKTIIQNIPDPEIYMNASAARTDKPWLVSTEKSFAFLGWGSTLGVMKDFMQMAADQGILVKYMHIKYLWPLKTEKIKEFLKENPETILIEGNYNGQLGQLIKMETGVDIKNKLLKWDGRPFFVEEIFEFLKQF